MKGQVPAVLIVCLSLLSCESHTVDQIKVVVPAGVTVPEGMVYIPEGEFIMGHPEDPRTRLGKKVNTAAYLIDRYEVTREDYAKFDPRPVVDEGKGAWPRVLLNFAEAEAHCKRRGGRLPTEAEWEKAARGIDGRTWPWLNFFEHPNNGFSGFLAEPVDRRPEWISPYGLYGMGHNVWEWVADDYGYAGQPLADRGRFKVIRGGLTQTHLTIKFTPTYFRNWMDPEARYNFLGFRCAKEMDREGSGSPEKKG